MQVDWGHFGKIQIGRAERALMAFVMVLSWSRRIFLRFYLNQRMESFLRGHVAAFSAFQGVPRVALYDNLRSAVLERRGEAIRFHPRLLELADGEDLTERMRGEPMPADEAIAIANDSDYGLTASGWTRSRPTARRLQRELQAGVVTINDSLSSFGEPTAPWGGIKQSGIGREHGHEGLEEYLQLKHVRIRYREPGLK